MKLTQSPWFLKMPKVCQPPSLQASFVVGRLVNVNVTVAVPEGRDEVPVPRAVAVTTISPGVADVKQNWACPFESAGTTAPEGTATAADPLGLAVVNSKSKFG